MPKLLPASLRYKINSGGTNYNKNIASVMNVYPHNKAKEINNFLPELNKSEQSWTMYSRIWYRHHIWHCAPYCHASHHQPSQELLLLPLTSASCFLDSGASALARQRSSIAKEIW